MNDTEPRYRISRYTGMLATALVVIVVAYLFICWEPQTTILLVRHADWQEAPTPEPGRHRPRAGSGPRAREVGVSAIYHQRSHPYSGDRGAHRQPARHYAAGRASRRRDRSREHDPSSNSGQTVLVVGHSNTVPQIIAEFRWPGPAPSARPSSTTWVHPNKGT